MQSILAVKVEAEIILLPNLGTTKSGYDYCYQEENINIHGSVQ
jgi:hypothetical protein